MSPGGNSLTTPEPQSPRPMRVLVTGHEGYIGSIMAPALAARGHDVVGLDVGYYRECTLVAGARDIPVVRKDIRDLEPVDLRGFEAVVHLAALSNDPIGNLNEAWTAEINDRASVRLALMAREAGVRRFLFSSSCIMYGVASDRATVNEDSPLDPQTEYARSKVRSERAIADLVADRFSPTFLRNGTVYGLSPRMRFDTVFNNLMGSAVTTGEVIVRSDGRPWRPVVHVSDVARAFAAVLEAPRSEVHGQAFNTGADHLNHQVIELAQIAVDTVPGCRLEVRAEPDADQRTYRTDFSKFARTFPDFEFRWSPREGAKELLDGFRAVGLTYEDYTDRRFTRLKWLRHLLDTGQLDQDLRWAPQATGLSA
jgi:nucleoside-diphosphate-sugar epimerase